MNAAGDVQAIMADLLERARSRPGVHHHAALPDDVKLRLIYKNGIHSLSVHARGMRLHKIWGQLQPYWPYRIKSRPITILVPGEPYIILHWNDAETEPHPIT